MGDATFDGECLWDANDVARYLKVSRSWVYQRADADDLPTVRIGGLLRFVPSEIRAYALGERPAARVVTLRTRLQDGRS